MGQSRLLSQLALGRCLEAIPHPVRQAQIGVLCCPIELGAILGINAARDDYTLAIFFWYFRPSPSSLFHRENV
jgi:hypothetical protein